MKCKVLIGSLAWGPSHDKTVVYKKGDIADLPEEVAKRLCSYQPYEVEILPEEKPAAVKK